jgi:DNA-binding NarL/FixJ family response regulator
LIAEDDDVFVETAIVPHFGGGWRLHKAYNLAEALEAARTLADLRLAIVDLNLPGAVAPFDPDIAEGHGFAVIHELRRRFATAPVLVLTGYLTPACINRAHELGAEYVVKTECTRNLELQVRRLVASEHLEGERGRGIAAFAQEHGLSPRETEVLALAIARATRSEIADVLRISQWTVKSQVRSILRKCNAVSLREIALLLRTVRG